MVPLFWDASALVKRYVPELGWECVDALLSSPIVTELLTTPWGYVETYASLLRKLNGGSLDGATFAAAVMRLQQDILGPAGFRTVSIPDAMILASTTLMRRHNLNSTDAAILTVCLDSIRALPPGSPTWVMVASDRRLRAAGAEGMTVLNPETLAAADVDAYLASL